MSKRHPLQPVVKDDSGVLRFKANPIVRRLLDHGKETGLGLNELHREGFDREDWVQLNQLIGYSVSGCPMMTGDEQEAVDRMADAGESEVEARLKIAEEKLAVTRDQLRDVVADLFGIHPDDLKESLSGVL